MNNPTEEKAGYIYRHTSPSGNAYIGKSLAAGGKRWSDHIRAAYDKTYTEYQYPLQRAIRKYGECSFVSEVLEDSIPADLLSELEVLYIEKYNTFYDGYNQTKGGEGTAGERSPAAKKAIAKANTERIWTEEMRGKMRASKTGAKGSKFVPWFIERPDGSVEEFIDKDKATFALEQGWYVGSFKNLFSKQRNVGNRILRGLFKGYRVGNLGEIYE